VQGKHGEIDSVMFQLTQHNKGDYNIGSWMGDERSRSSEAGEHKGGGLQNSKNLE